jgi:hypothetical protein
MTPEGKVKEGVKRGLRLLFNCHGNWPVQAGMGTQMLDWVGCVGGRYVAIETKAPGKKLTPRQEATAADVRAAGGVVFVVDSEEKWIVAFKRLQWLDSYFTKYRAPSAGGGDE